MKFREFILLVEKKSQMEILKDNKIALTDEERKEAMDADCVWNFSHLSSPSCAIWKSKDSSGKIWYLCNTHRCAMKSPTLKGAIKNFDFVKTTA